MRLKREPSSARPRCLPSSTPRLGLLLLAGLAGCGGNTTGPGSAAGSYSGTPYPVQGQVLLPSGKPLTSGRIIFMPKDPTRQGASGDIGADGNFTLKMADSKEGAQEGEYKVRIEPTPDMVPRSKTGLSDPTKSLPFPAKYTDVDGDTGLTATVKPEPNKLEPFRLVKDAPTRADRRGND